MREPSVTSDVEKTPPHLLEEEEDDGVQVSIAEVFAWQLSNKVIIVQRTFLVVDWYVFFQWLKPIPKD